MKNLIYLILILNSNLLFSQNSLESLKGEKINASFSFQFAKAYYYDYKLNSRESKDSIYDKVNNNALPEGMLTQKNASLFTKKGKLIIYSKFTFIYNDLKFIIIKYRKNEQGIQGKIEYYTLQYAQNQWNEISNLNNVAQDFKTILGLKNEIFSYFESISDNEKYVELKQIRSQSKDADGTLNIRLLAQNITNNPSLFAKYIDK